MTDIVGEKAMKSIELPQEWSIQRLRDISTIRPSSIDKKNNDDEEDVQLCNYTDVYYNDWITGDIDFMDSTATESEIGEHLLQQGDILLTKDSEDRDDIGNPALVTENFEDIVCGYHLFHVTPNKEKIDPEYLFWCLKSDLLSFQFRSYAKGVTRYGLTKQKAANVLIPVPPLSVQRQISSSIRSQYEKTESLIANEGSLLDLIEEKRQAVIREGVTGGLVDSETRKPSEIPWLGKIPESWKVGKVGWYFDVQLGKMLDSSEIEGDNLAPYLRNKDVQWRDINTENLPEMDFDPGDRRKYNLEEGDILVCEGGEIGRSAIVRDENPQYYYQKALHRVRPLSDDLSPEFFCYFMEFASNSGVFSAESNESTISHLTAEKLNNLHYPVPPIEQQESIIAKIDNVTRRIENLKQRVNEHINHLDERNQSVIDSSITGCFGLTNEEKLEH